MEDTTQVQVPKSTEEGAENNQNQEQAKLKARAGRVIVRNIHFDMAESHLKKTFSKFGAIQEVSVPKKDNSNLNRGFAFVEFGTKEEAQSAVTAMHNSKWKGRTLAVEFSVPKGHYEHKIDSIVEHTKLSKSAAQLPKNLREEKEAAEEQKRKAKEEKEEYEKKNARKIKQQEKKKAKKVEAKKEQAKQDEAQNPALFVRNIGFETTQEKFKVFMEKFGPVKYALLCKAKFESDSAPHKGTGFVRFESKETADQLVELSAKVESQMDEERKNSRLKKANNESLVSSLSLLKTEIELDGRRLIVKPSVSKEEAASIKEKEKEDKQRQKDEEDKRNLGMAKEGLLNEDNWLHKKPAPTKGAMELRQRLWISKDKALKKSTNLYISKTRLQIRNLPRKEFYEAECKELMKVVAEEWSHTMTQEDRKAHYTNKKHVSHVKIMRDEQKMDAQGKNLPSGQAFVEFVNPDLAYFAVRYLNNMEVVPGKGLIADFSMEDQRALFKRKEKIERWRKIAKEKKEEELKEQGPKQKPKFEVQHDPSSQPLDLGELHAQKKKAAAAADAEMKAAAGKKENQLQLEKITDVKQLQKLLSQVHSRGQKQRIKRKIERLQEEKAASKTQAPDHSLSGMGQQKDEKPAPQQVQKPSAKEKIEQILKKREKKLEQKQQQPASKMLSEEERDIVKTQKNKKREERRKRNRGEEQVGKKRSEQKGGIDEFDGLLEKYKSKLIKKLEEGSKGGDAFQEVDVSD